MKQRKYRHPVVGGLSSLLILLGAGSLLTTPAAAQSIDFDDAETNYRTYTHNPDPDALYEYTEGAAVRALTDGDPTTNVELWYKSESPNIGNPELVNRNVSFTATNGTHQVRVSSVATSDWDDYGEEWLNGFLAQYAPLSTEMKALSAPAQVAFEEVFKTVGLGDPNVSEFVLTQEGGIQLQTVGFYDLRDVVKERAIEGKVKAQKVAVLATASEDQKAAAAASAGVSIEELEQEIDQSLAVVEGLDALLAAVSTLEEELQASEVAKVEIYEDGVIQAIEYAYTFDLVKSDFTALDDGVSFSGVADWSSATNAAAPEPSFLLGAAIAGGLFRAGKRRSKSLS